MATETLKTPAVLLITHGSREYYANRQFHYLARRYARRHPSWVIRSSFLENGNPSIDHELNNLSTRSHEIDILPLFLFAAQHINKDIPEILNEFQIQHPDVTLRLRKELGPDPVLAQLSLERMKRYCRHSLSTIVLMLGRGARDPKALEDFHIQVKQFSHLQQFQKVLPCFFEAAEPSLEMALQAAGSFNPKRIVILPYLLFKGSWQKKVSRITEEFRKKNSIIEVRKAPPLGFHPILMELLDKRLNSINLG